MNEKAPLCFTVEYLPVKKLMVPLPVKPCKVGSAVLECRKSRWEHFF